MTLFELRETETERQKERKQERKRMRQTERGTIKKGGQRKRDRGVCFFFFSFLSFFPTFTSQKVFFKCGCLKKQTTTNKTKQIKVIIKESTPTR